MKKEKKILAMLSFTTVILITMPISVTASFSDEFSNSILDSRWVVFNKNSDHSIILTDGNLRMTTVPVDRRPNYSNGSSWSNIAVMQQVGGDWIIETKVNFLPTRKFQGAGILMCSGKEIDIGKCSITAIRQINRMERSIIRSVGNPIDYTNDIAYFKIMKLGNSYTGWYSSDGTNWTLGGEKIENTVMNYIGLMVEIKSLEGEVDTYAVADFDYFRITQLTPGSNITQDIVTVTYTNASINLYSEKTDIMIGDDVLFKLSVVDLITKPKMSAQVIITPPSGMIVTSSAFVTTEPGQYAANFDLEPGDGRNIEISMRPNQIGDFNINGRVIYYFDGDKKDAEDHVLNMNIKVRDKPVPIAIQKSPEFEIIMIVIILLIARFSNRY